jgi:predicted amidophosphoribosyltransferase
MLTIGDGVRGRVLPWLLPLACACCRQAVEIPGSTGALCRLCARERQVAPPLEVPPGLSACLAPFAYDGVVKHEVLSMKATGRFGTVPFMARAMYEEIRPMLHPDVLIMWPPTSKHRARERGFDQAEELARSLATISGCVAVRGLVRLTQRAQHGNSLAHRSDVAFRARSLFSPGQWPDVLLVDDVRTTGATFGAAARAIRDKGGEKIIGIAYAATPHRR